MFENCLDDLRISLIVCFVTEKKERFFDAMRVPSAKINSLTPGFSDTKAYCETPKSRIHSVEFQCVLHCRTQYTESSL